MIGGCQMNIPQAKCNSICYYFSEEIRVIKIFEEIHMAKVVFIESARERIVDINGISKKSVYDVSIPIKLLGGERR